MNARAIAILTVMIVGLGIGQAATRARQLERIVQSDESAAPTNVTEGFKLAVEPSESVVQVGQPINLKITLTNTTLQPLYIVERGALKDYKVEVKNEKGVMTRRTAEGKLVDANEGEDFLVIGIAVQPGQQRQDLIEISKFYDMTTPGTYSITVKRRVRKLSNRNAFTDAVSNAVTVKVI
jgi:hypothetical protein